MHPNVTLNLVSSAHLLFRTGRHFSSCVPPSNSLPIISPGKRILSLENATNRFPRERDFCSFSSPIALLEAEPCSSRCSFKAPCVLIKDISGCKPFHQRGIDYLILQLCLFSTRNTENSLVITHQRVHPPTRSSPLAIV